MKLEQYLTEFGGGDTSATTNMELAIVQTWNGETLKNPEHTVAAQNIVNYLRRKRLFKEQDKAEHLGSGRFTISRSWKRFGGSDGTPKTDLLIGGRRISLKKMGTSQLMSGAKGETRATFHTVVNRMKTDQDEIVLQLEAELNRMVGVTRSKLSITQQKETHQEVIDFKEAEKVHKQSTKMLKALFVNNTVFRDAVVREAMTGKHKFGKGIPVADYLLVSSADGKINNFHRTNDQDYIAKLGSKTKVSISWKSISRSANTDTGKEYTFFSVLRLHQSHVKNEMMKYEGQMLSEGKVQDILTSIKNWFSALWNKVKTWLLVSFENMLTFLGMDGEVHLSPTEIQ